MSDYKPITGELRKYATVSWDPWPDARDRLYQMCDRIDAIHAGLERENAELKTELDRVTGEQEDRRSCIYYDAERHYCSCHDINTDGLVELPKDVDGVPIRVGDTVECVDCTPAPRNVTSIDLAGDGWWVYINGVGRRPDKYRHVTPDTWESIIEDALGSRWSAPNELSSDFTALVARCKALSNNG